MKISELAELTGCKIETIRYWEKQGLLPEPDRSGANYREYSREHLERLSFIRNCRSLDMTQSEIRELLHFLDSPGEDCSGVNQVLDRHIGHVSQRISELMRLEAQLSRLRKQCTRPDIAERCSILHDLSLAPSGKPSSLDPHKGPVH